MSRRTRQRRTRPRRDKGQGISAPNRSQAQGGEPYRFTERDIEAVRRIHAARTRQAQRTDEALTAPMAPTPSRWIKYPDRYDVLGVDYPEGKIRKAMEKRSEAARRTDRALRAPIAPTPEEWMKHPERYDYPGVDTKQKPEAKEARVDERKIAEKKPVNPMATPSSAKKYLADVVETYRRRLGIKEKVKLSAQSRGTPARIRHYASGKTAQIEVNYRHFAHTWEKDPGLTKKYLEYAIAHELAHERQYEDLGHLGVAKASKRENATLELDADMRATKAMGVSEETIMDDMKKLAEKSGGIYESRYQYRKLKEGYDPDKFIEKYRDRSHEEMKAKPKAQQLAERMKVTYIKALSGIIPTATQEELTRITEKAMAEKWIKPDDDKQVAMERVTQKAKAELVMIRQAKAHLEREEQMKRLKELHEKAKPREEEQQRKTLATLKKDYEVQYDNALHAVMDRNVKGYSRKLHQDLRNMGYSYTEAAEISCTFTEDFVKRLHGEALKKRREDSMEAARDAFGEAPELWEDAVKKNMATDVAQRPIPSMVEAAYKRLLGGLKPPSGFEAIKRQVKSGVDADTLLTHVKIVAPADKMPPALDAKLSQHYGHIYPANELPEGFLLTGGMGDTWLKYEDKESGERYVFSRLKLIKADDKYYNTTYDPNHPEKWEEVKPEEPPKPPTPPTVEPAANRKEARGTALSDEAKKAVQSMGFSPEQVATIEAAAKQPTPATPKPTVRKRTETYDYYTDPGHGWLRVPVKKLEELGIADDISPYSYVKGSYAYLEEDSDAGKFIEAMKQKGVDVKWRDHTANQESSIRGYQPYKLDDIKAARKAKYDKARKMIQEADKPAKVDYLIKLVNRDQGLTKAERAELAEYGKARVAQLSKPETPKPEEPKEVENKPEADSPYNRVRKAILECETSEELNALMSALRHVPLTEDERTDLAEYARARTANMPEPVQPEPPAKATPSARSRVASMSVNEANALIRDHVKAHCPTVSVRKGRGTAAGWLEITGSKDEYGGFTDEEKQQLAALGISAGGNLYPMDFDIKVRFIERNRLLDEKPAPAKPKDEVIIDIPDKPKPVEPQKAEMISVKTPYTEAYNEHVKAREAQKAEAEKPVEPPHEGGAAETKDYPEDYYSFYDELRNRKFWAYSGEDGDLYRKQGLGGWRVQVYWGNQLAIQRKIRDSLGERWITGARFEAVAPEDQPQVMSFVDRWMKDPSILEKHVKNFEPFTLGELKAEAAAPRRQEAVAETKPAEPQIDLLSLKKATAFSPEFNKETGMYDVEVYNPEIRQRSKKQFSTPDKAEQYKKLINDNPGWPTADFKERVGTNYGDPKYVIDIENTIQRGSEASKYEIYERLSTSAKRGDKWLAKDGGKGRYYKLHSRGTHEYKAVPDKDQLLKDLTQDIGGDNVEVHFTVNPHWTPSLSQVDRIDPAQSSYMKGKWRVLFDSGAGRGDRRDEGSGERWFDTYEEALDFVRDGRGKYKQRGVERVGIWTPIPDPPELPKELEKFTSEQGKVEVNPQPRYESTWNSDLKKVEHHWLFEDKSGGGTHTLDQLKDEHQKGEWRKRDRTEAAKYSTTITRVKGAKRVAFDRRVMPIVGSISHPEAARIEATKDKITFNGMDPTHVSMLKMVIPNELDIPTGRYEAKEANLDKRTTVYKHPKKVQWDNVDHSLIIENGDQKSSVRYEKVETYESDLPEPKIYFKAKAKLDIDALLKASDISGVEHIALKVKRSREAYGDTFTYEATKRETQTLPPDEDYAYEREESVEIPVSGSLGEVTKMEEDEIKATYTASLLNESLDKIAKAGFTEATLEFSEDMPLKISATRGDGPYTAEFWLAPCIGV